MVLNPNVKDSQRDRTDTLSLLRKATMESIAETEDEKSNVFFDLFTHVYHACTFTVSCFITV